MLAGPHVQVLITYEQPTYVQSVHNIQISVWEIGRTDWPAVVGNFCHAETRFTVTFPTYEAFVL